MNCESNSRHLAFDPSHQGVRVSWKRSCMCLVNAVLMTVPYQFHTDGVYFLLWVILSFSLFLIPRSFMPKLSKSLKVSLMVFSGWVKRSILSSWQDTRAHKPWVGERSPLSTRIQDVWLNQKIGYIHCFEMLVSKRTLTVQSFKFNMFPSSTLLRSLKVTQGHSRSLSWQSLKLSKSWTVRRAEAKRTNMITACKKSHGPCGDVSKWGVLFWPYNGMFGAKKGHLSLRQAKFHPGVFLQTIFVTHSWYKCSEFLGLTRQGAAQTDMKLFHQIMVSHDKKQRRLRLFLLWSFELLRVWVLSFKFMPRTRLSLENRSCCQGFSHRSPKIQNFPNRGGHDKNYSNI